MTTMETAMRVGRGATILLVGGVAASLIGFIYRVIAARWLGPTDFGILALLGSVNIIFDSLFEAGLPTSIIRFVAQCRARKEDAGVIPSSILLPVVVLAIIASIILLLLAKPLAEGVFDSPGAVTPFRIAAIAVFCSIVAIVFRATIRGFERFEYAVILNIVNVTVALIGTVVLLSLGFDLTGAAWAWVLGFVLMTIAAWLFSRRLVRIKLSSASKEMRNSLLKFSAPLLIASAVNTVRFQAGIWLIGYFLCTGDVGYYSIALGIPMIMVQFTNPLLNALFPVYTQSHAIGDTAALTQMFNRAMKYTLYLFIAGAVGILLLAETILEVIYGAEYLPGVTTLRILAFAALFIPMEGMGRQFLISIGKPGLNMRIVIVSTVIMLVLCIILIPIYEVPGAAIAVVASRFVAAITSLFFIVKEIKIQPAFLIRSILSAGIMALFLLFVPFSNNAGIPGLIGLVLGGAIIYLSSLYLAGGFDKNDKRLVKEFTTRTINKYMRRNRK